MLAQTSAPDLLARTAQLYERVKAVIPPIEWPVFARDIDAILALKRARNAVILAHNYQTPEIFHCVADFVGDSLQLAREAAKVDADIIKAAQEATMLTKNSSFAELHTLACVYASAGKSAEARDALLKAMALQNLSEPNSAVWYGFGSIYEQYGVNDAAIEAYKKVERPEGRLGPTSTYALAQLRLKALDASER